MISILVPSMLIALLGLPALAFALLGVPAWFGHRYSEAAIGRIVGVLFSVATLVNLALLGALVYLDTPTLTVTLGRWFAIGHHAFRWTLIGDRLSLPLSLLSTALVGLIGAFSRRYLHREPGYFRFYLLLSLFGAGVQLVLLAGSLDLLFFGWEIVGLTSALLIAFFHGRRNPVVHGLQAFVVYRFCDVGLLTAAVWLHHTTGTAAFAQPLPDVGWATLGLPQSAFDRTLVGFLLLWAAVGKGALLPTGGWLPRAMEGPTPSSAIFYGAISVHLGPFLLLRCASALQASPWAAAAAVALGLATAAHATFVGRVQTDIKSALAYASMTQVGLIVVEVGLGLYTLAVIHIVGHAAVRSLQILRSPSLLHDHHHLEQAIGTTVPRTGLHLERIVPRFLQPWLYRHALERGYFDALLRDHVVGTVLRLLRRVDAIDRVFSRWLSDPKGASAKAAHGERVAS